MVVVPRSVGVTTEWKKKKKKEKQMSCKSYDHHGMDGGEITATATQGLPSG